MASGQFPQESNAVSGGYYLNNLVSIGQYLMSNGYSQAAAAGIAGTIAGESTGNPESVGSGGAGLIGWTPPSSASPYSNIITGNAQNDFNNQLVDLIAYANANSAEAVNRGGVDLSTLKAATDPTQAASWWSAFEGPLVPGSDVRTGIATSIFTDLNGYAPSSGYQVPPSLATPAGGGSDPTTTLAADTCLGVTVPFIHTCLGVKVPTVQTLEGDIASILERAGLFILGGIFVIMGVYLLFKGDGSSKPSPSQPQQSQSPQQESERESEDTAASSEGAAEDAVVAA